MKVVGVGCGPGMITPEAIDAIRNARQIYGSARAIEIAREHIPEGCEVEVIRDYGNIGALPGDAVLLSTGDPMLAGLGAHGARVIPGISSMQVAFARLGLPLDDAVVAVAHGKDHETAMRKAAEELARGRTVYLVADPKFDVGRLGSYLTGHGIGCDIAICEDLGYPGERIEIGTALSPPAAMSGLFSLVLGRLTPEVRQ
jgi:cobalt-precorrin-7 (C5)-methyltransferase